MITKLREFLTALQPKNSYHLFRYTDEAYKLKNCYHPVILQKKNGGMRILQVPDERLKRLQRKLLAYLEYAEISPCAAAYVKGRSLVDHARVHQERNVLVKLDLEDFFGSIHFSKVFAAVDDTLKRSPVFSMDHSRNISWFIAKACTLEGVLPQGAPTSPVLSNMVFLPLDNIIHDYCSLRGIGYTRYSDDLFFSGDFQPAELIRFIRRLLLKNGYLLNENKIVVAGRGRKKQVTGIVVNQHPQVDRNYRREIRQSIYYIGKYGLEEHLIKRGLIQADSDKTYQMGRELQRLIGRIAFVLQIDPNNKEFQEYKELTTSLFNRLPLLIDEFPKHPC